MFVNEYLIPVAHEDPDDLVALAFEHQGRDRRVHPTRHGTDHPPDLRGHSEVKLLPVLRLVLCKSLSLCFWNMLFW